MLLDDFKTKLRTVKTQPYSTTGYASKASMLCHYIPIILTSEFLGKILKSQLQFVWLRFNCFISRLHVLKMLRPTEISTNPEYKIMSYIMNSEDELTILHSSKSIYPEFGTQFVVELGRLNFTWCSFNFGHE